MDNNSKLKLNIDLSNNINHHNNDKPVIINIPDENIEITQLENKIENKLDKINNLDNILELSCNTPNRTVHRFVDLC